MRFTGRFTKLASLLALAASLQIPAIAQTGVGYYSAIVPRNPVDTRMKVLYERLDNMYNSGIVGPLERIELVRDLDGIQNYELRARNATFGMSTWAIHHLNRKLDVFSARLDARMVGV